MSDSTFEPFALGEGLSIRTQAGGDARSISNGPVPAALEFAKDVTTRITIGGGHEELGVIKHQTADEERNPFAGILSTARNNAGGRTARITDDTRVLIGFNQAAIPWRSTCAMHSRRATLRGAATVATGRPARHLTALRP